MHRIRAVMATTHVDRHNERLTLEALESMKAHIDSEYLPFIFNHDPRCPPLGRVVAAEIKQLVDGEHAIEADVEVFDPGDDIPFDQSRTVPHHSLPADQLQLSIDRTFCDERFDEQVSALATLFGSTPVHEVKKALYPIAVLGIGLGAVAVGKFTWAFFSKLGSNAADALSARLKQIFRKGESKQVQLLRFEFGFIHLGQDCRAELIVTGPSESDIDGLLKDGIAQVDRALPLCLTANVTRYVFEYSNGKSTLKFAVRSDSVPLFPTS